jgi:phage gp16-like protein
MANNNPSVKDFKQRQLAKIHIAKKDLNLDEETYRAIIRQHGAESSAKLTMLGRAKVIKHMVQRGWEDKHP